MIDNVLADTLRYAKARGCQLKQDTSIRANGKCCVFILEVGPKNEADTLVLFETRDQRKIVPVFKFWYSLPSAEAMRRAGLTYAKASGA